MREKRERESSKDGEGGRRSISFSPHLESWWLRHVLDHQLNVPFLGYQPLHGLLVGGETHVELVHLQKRTDQQQ